MTTEQEELERGRELYENHQGLRRFTDSVIENQRERPLEVGAEERHLYAHTYWEMVEDGELVVYPDGYGRLTLKGRAIGILKRPIDWFYGVFFDDG